MNRRSITHFGALAVVLIGVAIVVALKGGREGNGQIGGEVYSRAKAEGELRAARTPSEEHAVFDRIARSTRVAFALYDAEGKQLGMSTSDWRNHAHAIRFLQFGDPPVEHTVVKRENIFTLMRE